MAAILDSFDALLRAAREQPVRQRFLLVFVKAVLPANAEAGQATRFEARRGGALEPVMYVDKGEYELVDFDSLVAEAGYAGRTLGKDVASDWDLVIVGCMGGYGAREPEPEAVQKALNDLVHAIRVGRPLGHLAAFDSRGDPVRFE